MKIIHREDDTFVVDGLYHVTSECQQYEGQYKKLLAAYKKTPGDFTAEAPVQIDPKEQIIAELNAIDAEYRTPRTLAGAQRGDEEALKLLEKAETLCIPLRQKLKELQTTENKGG